MRTSLDRRDFIRAAAGTAAGVALWRGARMAPAAERGPGAPHAEKLGWLLGCQAYSFNRYTFHEAIEKIVTLGLKYVEAYPGQKLSAKQPDVKIGDGMSPAVRSELKKFLADNGVKWVNYGVVGLPKDEAASRKVFDFAKDLGVETIVSEPTPDAFDTIEKLCEEYKINVALHNHPEPSRYWNPKTILEACKGRSKRIGACADTGHWMRSGINPIDAIRLLQGRIICFHFKDLNGYGKGVHDVPWGTGKADVKGMLTEIRRQKLAAVFSIEYEHNWTSSLPEIAQSVAYFDKIAAELAEAK